MNLLQQLHIWKLHSCAARHAKKARSLKKRLLSEIRSLNLEIRHHEHCQQTSSRLASRQAFKLEQGKSLDWQSKGQESASKEAEKASLGWGRYIPPKPRLSPSTNGLQSGNHTSLWAYPFRAMKIRKHYHYRDGRTEVAEHDWDFPQCNTQEEIYSSLKLIAPEFYRFDNGKVVYVGLALTCTYEPVEEESTKSPLSESDKCFVAELSNLRGKLQ